MTKLLKEMSPFSLKLVSFVTYATSFIFFFGLFDYWRIASNHSWGRDGVWERMFELFLLGFKFGGPSSYPSLNIYELSQRPSAAILIAIVVGLAASYYELSIKARLYDKFIKAYLEHLEQEAEEKI